MKSQENDDADEADEAIQAMLAKSPGFRRWAARMTKTNERGNLPHLSSSLMVMVYEYSETLEERLATMGEGWTIEDATGKE